MNSRPALTLGAIALFALAFSAPALAQPTEAQMAAIKSNCRSDYMAKCMSVKPGGPEAFQCLKKNEASLSAACKSAVNAISAASGGGSAPAQEAKPAATQAPAAPAHASPAPASPPPAPAVAAPPAHKPAAAAAAAAAPAQPSAAQQNAIKQNCRNDFMSHCSGVQPGGAEALNCLKTNTAKLAPACKSAVAAIGGAPAAAKPAAVAATTPPAAATPVTPPPAAMPAPKLGGPMEARIIREFCFTDFRVLCRGVKLGQGRALQCLASNAPALSPGCKAAMAQASR
jgi:hypothetical protein